MNLFATLPARGFEPPLPANSTREHAETQPMALRHCGSLLDLPPSCLISISCAMTGVDHPADIVNWQRQLPEKQRQRCQRADKGDQPHKKTTKNIIVGWYRRRNTLSESKDAKHENMNNSWVKKQQQDLLKNLDDNIDDSRVRCVSKEKQRKIQF